MSSLVGRQEIVSKSKSVFTAGDVVREGFLMKRGSWFKNWKSRFFILRRDVKELCYYSNSDKESLTLVGSITLDGNTKVTVHDAKDGGNLFFFNYRESTRMHLINNVFVPP